LLVLFPIAEVNRVQGGGIMQAMLTDALGYVAAGLVFATFCAQRMISLRSIAIASNLAFIGYGYLDRLWPILILHSAMLPINIVRCRQSIQGFWSTAAAKAGAPRHDRRARSHPSSRRRSIAVAALDRMRRWRARERFRGELSSLSSRDFGDLAVPPSLIADELRRWPWQEPSAQWGTAASRPSGEDIHDVDGLGRRT
jgi:uncharacterized protein YjiS (DUF1127 family)